MFTVEKLEKPETVSLPFTDVICTHKKTSLTYIDPTAEVPVRLVITKGVMVDDKFVAVPNASNEEYNLDQKGYADLLAPNEKGKPENVFRTSDIMPAIEKRYAEIAAESEVK